MCALGARLGIRGFPSYVLYIPPCIAVACGMWHVALPRDCFVFCVLLCSLWRPASSRSRSRSRSLPLYTPLSLLLLPCVLVSVMYLILLCVLSSSSIYSYVALCFVALCFCLSLDSHTQSMNQREEPSSASHYQRSSLSIWR